MSKSSAPREANAPCLPRPPTSRIPTSRKILDKPDKPKRSPSPPRRKNRFNEREFARAARAGRAVGAERVEVDPATGVISMILAKPNKPDAGDRNPWDEVRTNANQKRTT
jgi:hypothetical protein